jgi:hypothetical protein
MSVAASRLVHIVMPVFLGLTPQAKYLSPLRGSGRPSHVTAASRGHPTRNGTIRERMLPLRGFGGSRHEDGGDPGASHLRQISSCSPW